MPTNALTFAEKFATELDKLLEVSSKTGIFAQNTFGVEFIDARTVKLPRTDFVGLGDYSIDNGFPKGKVSVVRDAYTIQQDRGRTFVIDAVDIGDIGIAKYSGKVLSEFVRTKVVPEVDAYTVSKLGAIASTNNQTITTTDYPIASKPLEAILTLQSKIRNAGYDGEIIVYMPESLTLKLKLSPEVSRVINVDKFSNGGTVNFNVLRIEDVVIIPVPDNRMKTSYDFDAGSTTTAGGFAPKADAGTIQMLAVAKTAPSLIKKHQTMRIFSPEQNQDADAYKFDYRLHYDLLVKKSMQGTVWAMIDGSTPSA